MQIFSDTLPERARGGGWLIGNFDGVHKGHQAILSAQKTAWGQVSVITFEPHPRAFFAPDQPFLRLTTAAEKAERLARCGVGILLQLDFNAQLASLPAADFVQRVIIGQCGAQKLAVGQGFRFGAGRSGDIALLRVALGAANVTELVPVRDKDGEIYSSSRIRAALRSGDKTLADQLLGW